MKYNQASAIEKAKADLAERMGVSAAEIETVSVTEKDFSDMSLGAAISGEMSAQMISSGWQINLRADGESYEYRGDKYQLRLFGYKGANYVIE